MLNPTEKRLIVQTIFDSLDSLKSANVILSSKRAYSTESLREISYCKFKIEKELRLSETLKEQLAELALEDSVESLIYEFSEHPASQTALAR